MHIILGILGVLAAVGFWAYRVDMAARGARELADLAGTAANLPRKMRFQHKARRKGLAVVDDPREAATILMLGLARVAGEVSVEQKLAIRQQAATHFDMDEAGADELVARASWAMSDLANPEDAIPRMIDLIAERVDLSERDSLMAMLKAVALTEGEANADQAMFIAKCRSRLGLR